MNFLNDCEKKLLRHLSQYRNHWADGWNFRFPFWKVEEVPVEDDPPWEVKLVEVEEGEEVEDRRVVEEVAYSWNCLRRPEWMNFDPADY